MYNLIWRGENRDEDHISSTYDTWREMQEIAGEVIDAGRDDSYYIEHIIKGKLMGTYSLKDFISRTHPENFTLGLTKDKKPGKDLERERFHHLDDKETAEVLKYTSTGALIGELVRRSQEYESTVKSIREKLDSMKIYDVKH